MINEYLIVHNESVRGQSPYLPLCVFQNLPSNIYSSIPLATSLIKAPYLPSEPETETLSQFPCLQSSLPLPNPSEI